MLFAMSCLEADVFLSWSPECPLTHVIWAPETAAIPRGRRGVTMTLLIVIIVWAA